MKRRRGSLLLLWGLLCALLAAGAAIPSSALAADPPAGYVLSYFGGVPYDDSLHLAYSTDGLNWTPLNGNQPVFRPGIGTKHMRDPYVGRKQDGTFILLGTDNWNSEYLMAYDSADLIHWTNGRLIRMNTTAMHTWAPEMYYDASKRQYGIVWSGNTDRNRTYVNYTSDFRTVTAPSIYFDPGYDVIDSHIHPWNGTNYLFFKDERAAGTTAKSILAARSAALSPGSFSVYTGASITENGTEGPFVIKARSGNRWYLYADYYSRGGIFGAWTTTDLGSGSWTKLASGTFSLPAGVRHAAAVEVSQSELDRLKAAKWGPYRLQSHNYPDRYVRHSGESLRIDSNVSPLEDAQYRIVPGLADPEGVSFESVNQPGSYLRHYNYEMKLAQADGSAAFKGDATFTMTAGLADGSKVSLRSYNYPERYIRHYNYALVLQPAATDTDKADATFSLVYP
ncbi:MULTISPECIES: glycoside hydrolase family 43 protein [Paenibacillus]|uniref:glycoside hydrolase family 43 protein n=1 Tax=Paenibacillus TaxID=44249 RepID=UPI0022B9036E|nr:glycoside hydrolase family 43 protein [Paenibacillus caseinilyticus]MCZ8520172.1 glycoside hydrolase family 43 protein [Paenibacillus caseinilyticus]